MIEIIQTIDNEGPSAGNTQLPNGLSTAVPKPYQAGDSVLGFGTVATFGGAHTSWTFTDTAGNTYQDLTEAVGGQGDINSGQQLSMFYAQNLKAASSDEFLQHYISGDVDWQATLLLETAGLGAPVLPAQSAKMNMVAPGANVLNAGPAFVITQAMCPCVIVLAVQNLSQLGDHYTPTVGTGLTALGSWWKFGGEGKNLANLTVGQMVVTKPGSYQPTMNAMSTVAEDYDAVAAVFALTQSAASANDTLVSVGSTATITGTDGTQWGISSTGVVLVNGTPDTTTANVQELAYVGGDVWQRNAEGRWWFKKVPTDAWGPEGGTLTNPETGSTTSPPPTLVSYPLTAVQVASLVAGSPVGLTATIQLVPPAKTVAVPPTPPVVTPTPPPSGVAPLPAGLPSTGANVIYNGLDKGAELWPGDWSGGGVKENYNDKVNGVTCLTVTAVSAYPFWLPYAPLTGGPQGNTPTLDVDAYKTLVLIMKPTNPSSDTLNVGAYTYNVVNGVVQADVSTGGTTMTQYGGAPDENGFITYRVPLTAIGAKTPLYKIIVQDSSTPIGQSFAVKYAAFI